MVTTSRTTPLKHAATTDSSAWDSAYAPVPNGGAISAVPATIGADALDPDAQPRIITVAAGVTSTNLLVSGKGHEVNVYGTLSDSQLLGGASLYVHKGGVATHITLTNASFNDADVFVYSGGSLSDMVLSRNVDATIGGNTATGVNLTLNSGASLEVYSGGTTTNTVIYGGATQSVGSGGTLYSTVVDSGGQNYVFSSGVASNTQIDAGGYEFVSANGVSVSASVAGFQVISSSGVAEYTTVQAGGNVSVLNDAFSEFATIMGTVTVATGGEVYSDQIDAGGVVSVMSGGFQIADTVNSGGNVVVDGGSEYSLTVAAGGTLTYSGGFLNSTTLQSGVLSGATVSAIGGMLSGLNVHRGVGLAVGQGVETMFTVVSAGGVETLNGGTEVSGDILAGGTLTGFGTVTNLTNAGTLIASGGTLTVTNAITGTGTLATLAGADLLLEGGGSLTTNIIGTGTLEFGGSTAFTLVANLATPSHVIVDSGATLLERGSITGAILDNGTIDIPALGTPGGTTVLKGAVTGSGTLSADAHELLALNGGATFSGALAGAGTIQFNSNVTLDAGASLQAAEVLTTHNLTLGAATKLTNLAGHSLVLDETSAAATLVVTGPTGTGITNNANATLLAEGPGSVKVATALTNLGTVMLTGKALAFTGPLSNSGTIDAASGSLSIATTINGTGKLEIGATGTLALLGATGGGQTTDFLAATGDLSLTNPLNFHGIIGGFTQGDLIDLVNTTVTSLSYANNVLTVKDGTATVASLHFTGLSSSASFTMATDSAGGTFIKLH